MQKISNSVSYFMILVSSLISVAFFTILERKILGYIQIRKGPNKVGFVGILQPFSDAIKLFSKSIMNIESMNLFLSYLSPALTLLLSMMMWPIIPMAKNGVFDSSFSILTFLILSSLSVYSILLIGWSANSKYCYLGAIRSVAQMISYEVALFFIILTPALLSHSFAFTLFYQFQNPMPYMFLALFIFMMWLISCLAETNRSPLDFAEGESELVSGFNIEYMGGWFAFIFLAEYMNMVILSFMSTILFFYMLTFFLSFYSIVIITLLFIWVRGSFPRFRYDLLMALNWKIFLPLAISYFSLTFLFSFLSL